MDQGLTIKVTPAAKEVRPGQKVKVDLLTTDQLGRPVPAELSLSMVDEALLALYGDRYGSIADFFRGERREAAMRTTSSVTFRYEPETTRIASTLLEEGERLEGGGREEEAREIALTPLVTAVRAPTSWAPQAAAQPGQSVFGTDGGKDLMLQNLKVLNAEMQTTNTLQLRQLYQDDKQQGKGVQVQAAH